MSKYEILREYLENSRNNEYEISFEKIERIIGERLPSAAYRDAWWSTNGSNPLVNEVLKAGWEIHNIDFKSKKLTIRRKKSPQDVVSSGQSKNYTQSIANPAKIEKIPVNLNKEKKEKKTIQKQICPRCGGRGRVAVKRNQRLVRYPQCLKCRGSGFIPNRNEKCSVCKGEKRIRTRGKGLGYCTKCLGSGLKHPGMIWRKWTQGSSPK